MNDEYKSVYRHADSLRHRFRDVVDVAHHPEAKGLYNGLDQLAESFEMQKGARSLEDMAKRLAEEFKSASNQSNEIMDARHLNEFKDKLEEIVREVRKFSNY